MFQTSHPYSSFHAAARCVSGGPIYITDEPGKHDVNLINQMTAPNVRGQTVILRPSTVGKSVHPYVGFDEERLLRVGTYHGSRDTGSGILGVFNVSKRPLSEFIPLREFPGAKKNETYIVRAHSTGQISSPMRLDSVTPLVSLELAVKGWEILTAYRLQSFELKAENNDPTAVTQVAVIGLLGKMTAAAAIVASKMNVESNGRLRITTSLKALGFLG